MNFQGSYVLIPVDVASLNKKFDLDFDFLPNQEEL